VTVPGDFLGKLDFELDKEVGALSRFPFFGEGRGGAEQQKQKWYGDFVHRKFSGRSGGGVVGYDRR
jgi:hypothetical protein